ncbi:MAG: lipopolysaccharide heptosyltransferase II [Gammaproteobacteria bacterium]|nr:lipopolysaccharide heptosyltransferase II [Gammaproteobacteria bacterium]
MRSNGKSKVLVVGPAWVGDMVMAEAATANLSDSGAAVHVLAPAATAPIAKRMPSVTAVHELRAGHGQLALGERRTVARTLRREGFDQAIVLPNTLKSALVPWLARIPKRTGFRGEHRHGLLNDMRRLDPKGQRTMVDRFVSLSGGGYRVPQLTADPANLDRQYDALGLPKADHVVALCPGAEFGPAKRWPVNHFAEVAAYCAKRGASVWLFGNEAEKAACDSIASRVPESMNLAGRTDLASAIDLLSGADCVVANDSGLMHVAAALGRRVVALFGSTSPDFTPPLAVGAVALREPQPCSPCLQRTCRFDHYKCLVDLAPARVIKAIEPCMSS